MIKLVIVKKYLYLYLLSSLLSCAIPEGEGGQGIISGRVNIQVIEDFTIFGGPSDTVTNEYPAVDERVYIKYGDNTIYDDHFDTDENGYFKFTNLSKGEYKLFTYTYCDTCDSEVAPVYESVSLEKHTSEVDDINFFISQEED